MELRALPIPHDCVDGFLGAYWRRPRAYLDAAVRGAISTFTKLADVEPGLDRLRRDLDDGTWARRHAALLQRPDLDLGYRLAISPYPLPSGERAGGGGQRLRARGERPQVPRAPDPQRRERLRILLEDERYDTPPLAPLPDRRADLRRRPHQRVRAFAHQLPRGVKPGRELIGRRRRVVRDDRGLDQRVELERGEARPGGLPYPRDLLQQRGRAEIVPLEPAAIRRARGTSPTMSASRPARVSVRRPPPPIRMGGRGCWTPGRPSSSVMV